MATAMTATGWDAAGAVNVLRRSRPWGPNAERQLIVQFNFTPTNFEDGAGTYPSDGIPMVSPSTLGLRNNVAYVIPTSPFYLAGGAGAPSSGVKVLPWGFTVPTGGVSGSTPRNAGFIRMFGVRSATTVTAGAGAEPVINAVGMAMNREMTTGMAASDIGVTGITYTAYALVVGN